MAVEHPLPGLGARVGETDAVDNVVEAALQQLEEVGAGDAGHPAGHAKVVAELTLEDAVGLASLLLLPELESPVGDAATALRLVPRGLAALLHAALGREAPLALQE